jgi:hypothetical protein
MACSVLPALFTTQCFIYAEQHGATLNLSKKMSLAMKNISPPVRDNPRQNLHNNTSKWMAYIFVITTEQ